MFDEVPGQIVLFCRFSWCSSAWMAGWCPMCRGKPGL